MKITSLRVRLIAGSVLWSIGLLTVVFLVSVAYVHRKPASTLIVHNGLLIVTGTVLVTAGVSVIRGGLFSFKALRQHLGDVRDGRTDRLEGDYPSEIGPLVNDLNALLDDRERRVSQAAARASDLAHGLKTPLAVLEHDIEHADAAGQHDLVGSMREQVRRMRRQIDAHLAQARATAGPSPAARAGVAATLRGLVRTMDRLYAERGLTIAIAIADDLVVRVPAEDLEEMVGNLLDNACKWARSSVDISACREDRSVAIHVDDDGHGLDAALREHVLGRGVRADETASGSGLGSGLGLAIVRDLADAYGGAIVLDTAPRGGLRATLMLPASL